MIVCPRCSKENQDHYKFCLGCGAELPRDAAHAPKSFTAPTPPAGVPVASPGVGTAPAPAGVATPAAPSGFGAPPAPAGFGAPPAGFGAAQAPAGFGAPPAGFGAAPAPVGFGAAPAPVKQPQFGGAAAPPSAPAPAAAQPTRCPQCATMVPVGFKFCGTCGYDMSALAGALAPTGVPPAPAPVAAVQVRGSLTLIRPDGSEGESVPLHDHTPIGRDAGGPFATDSYLSPRHAEFTLRGAELWVKDEGSLNGVFVRIERDTPVALEPGAIFRVGQEILRFEPVPAPARGADGVEVMGSPNSGLIGRISLVIGRDTTGNSYAIQAGGMHLGRERGDIIFPEDGYVSGLHCRIHAEGGQVWLTDVGSSNGTFVRVRGERAVKRGALLLMGQQLFRADY